MSPSKLSVFISSHKYLHRDNLALTCFLQNTVTEHLAYPLKTNNTGQYNILFFLKKIIQGLKGKERNNYAIATNSLHRYTHRALLFYPVDLNCGHASLYSDIQGLSSIFIARQSISDLRYLLCSVFYLRLCLFLHFRSVQHSHTDVCPEPCFNSYAQC